MPLSTLDRALISGSVVAQATDIGTFSMPTAGEVTLQTHTVPANVFKFSGDAIECWWLKRQPFTSGADTLMRVYVGNNAGTPTANTKIFEGYGGSEPAGSGDAADLLRVPLYYQGSNSFRRWSALSNSWPFDTNNDDILNITIDVTQDIIVHYTLEGSSGQDAHIQYMGTMVVL